ncbi:hypothetical protein TNCT_414401 [Trichonephila clavata]|uniref:Uncharacterized protein n=1 Tax=Trichonephila clavata TaxID=2740835 RepID=A0A8X6L9R3_TRICU|nr:hypothetical protein TNCT_414401 [Trichonephila clavata]
MYGKVQKVFTCRFRKPDPTRLATKTLVNKFRQTDSDADGQCLGRSSALQAFYIVQKMSHSYPLRIYQVTG